MAYEQLHTEVTGSTVWTGRQQKGVLDAVDDPGRGLRELVSQSRESGDGSDPLTPTYFMKKKGFLSYTTAVIG